MKPTSEQKQAFRTKHRKVLAALNEAFDKEAQAIKDHQSMTESRTDRHIFAEMNDGQEEGS